MPNQKKLMRQANAICKIIRKAREEVAAQAQAKDHYAVRIAKALVRKQS